MAQDFLEKVKEKPKTPESEFSKNQHIKTSEYILDFFHQNKLSQDATKRKVSFDQWKKQIHHLYLNAKNFKKLNELEKSIYEAKAKVQILMTEKNFE